MMELPVLQDPLTNIFRVSLSKRGVQMPGRLQRIEHHFGPFSRYVLPSLEAICTYPRCGTKRYVVKYITIKC